MIDPALYPAVLARLFGLSGLVGQKKAVAIVVRNASGRRRWSKLDEWLDGAKDDAQGVIGPEARSVPGSPLTGAIPDRNADIFGWTLRLVDATRDPSPEC